MGERRLTVTIEPPDSDGEGNDMVIRHGGNIVFVHSDQMEPEDATFHRDLSWISEAIIRAYDLGRLDQWEEQRMACKPTV